jgi:D-alanyl-D-alanine carboxypeptidase
MRQRLRGSAIFASAMIALLLGTALIANAAGKAATTGPTGLEIRSAAALVVDGNNGEVIFER